MCAKSTQVEHNTFDTPVMIGQAGDLETPQSATYDFKVETTDKSTNTNNQRANHNDKPQFDDSFVKPTDDTIPNSEGIKQTIQKSTIVLG